MMAATKLDTARILNKFGLSAANLLGEGGESVVYALDERRILRLPRSRPFGLAGREHLRRSWKGLPGTCPSTHRSSWKSGRRRVHGETRLQGSRWPSFCAPPPTIRAIMRSQLCRGTRCFPCDRISRGTLRPPAGRGAGDRDTWRDFVHDSLARFRTAHRLTIARDVGDPYRLFDKATDMIEHLPLHPPKYLVHGDYFPGNVLLAPDLTISGVIDFGPFTVVGDPVLDLAVSYLTLELIAECSADDARFVRDLVLERHGEEIAPALRFYRAYLAFSMADPANSASPYPRLYEWAIAMLKLLAEDRLPV